MLSTEEAEEIKQKLISHIEETFPPEQIIPSINQIKNMNTEHLEKFLEENKIITNKNSEKECIFCSIVSGIINSIKIDEEENAVAVLEINPISRGHTLVIPKEHSINANKKSLSFAEKVGEKIKKKFKPKKIEFLNSKLFGHETISILPVYDNETFNSTKKPAGIEELKKIKEELEESEIPIQEENIVKKKEEFLWLPKRIP
jgi:histidine triad (HIT) family protein